MIIYKFGGASVKSADAVRNLANIVKSSSDHLIVVVSAMGKTTNALEEVVYLYFNRRDGLKDALDRVRDYHDEIMRDLCQGPEENMYVKVGQLFAELENRLQLEPSLNYDFDYDQVICFGELISTIVY